MGGTDGGREEAVGDEGREDLHLCRKPCTVCVCVYVCVSVRVILTTCYCKRRIQKHATHRLSKVRILDKRPLPECQETVLNTSHKRLVTISDLTCSQPPLCVNTI